MFSICFPKLYILKNKQYVVNIISNLLREIMIDDIITLILLYQNDESYYAEREGNYLKIYKCQTSRYQSNFFCDYKETKISCRLIPSKNGCNIRLYGFSGFDKYDRYGKVLVGFGTETPDEITRFISILSNDKYIDKANVLFKKLYDEPKTFTRYSSDNKIIIAIVGYTYHGCYVFKDKESVQDMINLLTVINQHIT
jgi:hypothetical protein